jgi:hypothetical protein
MRYVKILLLFAAIVLSFVPVVFLSAYAFTGFSKDSFIKILQEIPTETFWMLGIPMFATCYASTCFLVWKFLKIGISNPLAPRPKIVYNLEDPDINQKVSQLINVVREPNLRKFNEEEVERIMDYMSKG